MSSRDIDMGIKGISIVYPELTLFIPDIEKVDSPRI